MDGMMFNIRFNPTLVRLRRGRAPRPCPPSVKFQSHAGSIEAASARRASEGWR